MENNPITSEHDATESFAGAARGDETKKNQLPLQSGPSHGYGEFNLTGDARLEYLD